MALAAVVASVAVAAARTETLAAVVVVARCWHAVVTWPCLMR